MTLNIPAHRAQRDLIDEAAGLLGTSRSDFMLSAACRNAEEMLDAPPLDNPGLKALLKIKSPW